MCNFVEIYSLRFIESLSDTVKIWRFMFPYVV